MRSRISSQIIIHQDRRSIECLSNWQKAVLHLDGKEIELPIYSGTLGPDVIDVKDVLASGHFYF